MDIATLPQGLRVFERGWLSANNVLFTDGDKTLLVDSGYCTHAAQTLALIGAVLGERTLDVLVNTHLHSDHCGGNAALQAHYPALKTLIPPGQARHVQQWDPVALTYLPTGQQCPRFRFDETLVPGTAMRLGTHDWEVHSAAGHDPHSLIFFEPVTRTLISADALWEKGFGVVFPELEGAHAFEEVATTLALIARLNPKLVIPGHGRVFAYSPDIAACAAQRLEAFIQHPLKHARHAVKALLKFKLLEVQRQTFDEFMAWGMATPYFIQIRARFFADMPLRPWLEQLCIELIAAGVAAKEGPLILNA